MPLSRSKYTHFTMIIVFLWNRGPDHVTNGPCTCLKEINYRARNKEQEKSYFEYRKYMEQIKPYGFIKVQTGGGNR